MKTERKRRGNTIQTQQLSITKSYFFLSFLLLSAECLLDAIDDKFVFLCESFPFISSISLQPRPLVGGPICVWSSFWFPRCFDCAFHSVNAMVRAQTVSSIRRFDEKKKNTKCKHRKCTKSPVG